MPVRTFIALALALVACSGSDRSNVPATRTATPNAPVGRGPDALLLRVPKNGGVPRVTGYPNLDSTVWTATDAAPAIDRVLAFDADAGLIAAEARGAPVWIDLHTGAVTRPARGPLRGLTSVDGSTIYGIGADGAVARFTPAGNWLYKPPLPARAVFPQSNGTVLVLGGRGDEARLWRIHPPEQKRDSVLFAGVVSGVGAPLGDRVFFVRSPQTVIGLRARTLGVGEPIEIDHAIRSIATSPSGDRAYVAADSANAVVVIDPYQNRVVSRTELPGRPRELRVDPFGRYVLVRGGGDSVWVVSVGTDRVVETLRSQWRGDLPFVAIDGSIAIADGRDVVFHNGSSDKRVADGASDFWYPFVWNGLRPRAASLDAPPPPASDSDTVKGVPPVKAETTAAPAPTPAPDTTKAGFTVSFSVLLDETRARDEAAKISVNGQQARVVAGMTAGTAVYRIVLGPFPTRDEADRVGRASNRTYVIYAGAP